MRVAVLVGASAWFAVADPPEKSFWVTAPMAAGSSSEIDLSITQTAFTSSTSVTHDSHAHVNGHLVKVSNPLGRFSVVPPLPGGCGSVQYVPETAKLYNPSCILATDAGYYNLNEDVLFDCIGNVVSDGAIHNTEALNTSNVNFGVLKNGSFVIGYISPEDVETGIFQHLVAGLGWIVRDGKNYVDEGWKEAYTAAGSSGDEYCTMTSGRTAVGWDKDGGLIILQYDGHTHDPSWGATMNELADKMIEFGAIEAANLDGGGSTQMWRNGEQLGYSSDRATYGVLADTYEKGCPIGLGKDNLSAFECSRAVSTILCIHEDSAMVTAFLGASWLQGGGALTISMLLVGLACGGVIGFFGQEWLSKRKAGMLRLEEPSEDNDDDSDE